MCLFMVSKRAHEMSDAAIRYKVVRKWGGAYSPCDQSKFTDVPIGIGAGWALVDDTPVIRSTKGELYVPGVHAFLTEDDARAYRTWHDVVVKVLLRGPICSGTQLCLINGRTKELQVVVYKEMTILEELKEGV